MDGYISRRRAEGAADTTISKELVVLRKSLRLAIRAGLWRGRVDEVIPVAFSPGYEPRKPALTSSWSSLRRSCSALLASHSTEVEGKAVAPRRHGGADLKTMPLDAFVALMKKEGAPPYGRGARGSIPGVTWGKRARDSVGSRRLADVARAIGPAAAMGVAFVHALATSWRKWGNLVIDAGRELEIPRSLLDGGELYVTVRNLYGPLPAWLNAGLYALFGVHADVLAAAGIVVAAAMTLALYLLARLFVGRTLATLVAVWFVYVCAFGHLGSCAIFNFALPYSYAAIYGITAATFSLVFAVRHARRGRDRDLAVALAFAVATAACKLEPTLAVAAAHAALLGGSLASGTLTRRRLALYGAAAAVVAAFWGALTLRVGPGLWSENVLSAANAGVARYALLTTGLDDLPHSARAALLSGALIAAAFVTALVVDRLGARGDATRWSALAIGAAGGAALLGAGAATSPDVSLRALPVAALGVAGALVVRFARTPEARSEILPHLVLWAFALACLSRLGLAAVPYHYGFYLVPVPVAALAVALCGGLQRAVGREPWRPAAALPGAALLAGIGAICFSISAEAYERHTVVLETPRVYLKLFPEDAAALGVRLLADLPAGSRVISVPQGAGMVFAAGHRWADVSFAYVPTDVTRADDDPALEGRWSAHPPDAVLYLGEILLDYPGSIFGETYARRASRWIMENYRLASDPRDAVVLLRRR